MGAIIGAAAIGGAATLGAAYMNNRASGGGGGTPSGYMSPKEMAKTQMRFNEKMMNLNLKYLPQYSSAERQMTQDQRNADLSYLGENGTRLADALGQASPAYAYIGQEAARANQNDPLLSQLQEQAAQELSYNRQLSPEQEREAIQQARSGMAARGLATGPGGIFAEALNRDRYATARAADRRQFASNVVNMGQQADTARRGFLLNAANAQLSPILSGIYGNRSSVNVNAPSATAQAAPQLSGMTGMWDTVTNANYANQISARNNQAALLGAGIQGVSNIAGSYAMNQAQSKPVTAQPDYYMGSTPVYRGIQVS